MRPNLDPDAERPVERRRQPGRGAAAALPSVAGRAADEPR